MEIKPVELSGQRAKLVPLTKEHQDALYEASRPSEIWTYMPTKVSSREGLGKFIDEAMVMQERGIELPFVVVDQITNRIVGTTRYLNISASNRHLEIGWTWYHPTVWRTRINTECKFLLMSHAFETLDTVRVQICVDGRNDRSNQAVLRLGATKEGVLRRHRILSDGYIRDTCVYSVIDKDWPMVKTRLEYLLNEKYEK